VRAPAQDLRAGARLAGGDGRDRRSWLRVGPGFSRTLLYNTQAFDATGRNRFIRSPSFSERSKIAPTGTKPRIRYRPSAARPADATQPQFAQSGTPPNWHGVMRVVRSAETLIVVRAKT